MNLNVSQASFSRYSVEELLDLGLPIKKIDVQRSIHGHESCNTSWVYEEECHYLPVAV